jgi:hypothetical protein
MACLGEVKEGGQKGGLALMITWLFVLVANHFLLFRFPA